jgi:hypothetical protein
MIEGKVWQQLTDEFEDEAIRRLREGEAERNKSVGHTRPLRHVSRRGLGLGVALGVILWALLFLLGRALGW